MRRTMMEERPRGSGLAPLRLVLRHLLPYRWRMLAAAVALVVAAGAVLAFGQGLRHLVDEGLSRGDEAVLDRALVAMIAVVVIMTAATYCRFYLVTWLGERVVADIRREVFSHVLDLSPEFFETARTGEIQSRLTTDTTLLQNVVGSSFSIAVRNTLLIVGGLAMLILTSPKLTGLVLIVVPVVVVPILVYGRRVRRLSRAAQDAVGEISAYGGEALANIRTVQGFNHQDHDRAGFARRVDSAFGAAILRTKARAKLTAIAMLLAFGSVAVILWIGGQDMLAGEISGGDLSAFIFYAVVVAGGFGALSEVLGDLQRAAGAMERLTELSRTTPKIGASPAPTPLLPIGPDSGAVRFENITFNYPSRPDASAISGFDLDVRPGETVALVGPSGAGKTTLFQLLLRFYDPQSGRILLDGVDLRHADPNEARRRCGLVAQDPVIFSADVMENILYGRPDAGEEEAYAAAEAANALEFIDRFPDGFGSYLGERGVRLSGGQRQRIAIARVILRNPKVLLLDEATSALDAETERVVRQAMERLTRDRTTIVIAHRLATVRNADRIVVMDHGRRIAEGDHETLLAEGGLYSHLASLQFNP